jgi:hypothetical protein
MMKNSICCRHENDDGKELYILCGFHSASRPSVMTYDALDVKPLFLYASGYCFLKPLKAYSVILKRLRIFILDDAQSLPSLTLLVDGLPPPRSAFDNKPDYSEFEEGEVDLGHVYM